MTNLLSFLIELNIVIIALFLTYNLIRNRIDFNLRRRIIILIPLISSVVIWLQQFLLNDATGEILSTIELNIITVGSNIDPVTTSSINWNNIYYFGVILIALILIAKLGRVLYFFRNSNKTDNYKLLTSTNKDSFSFFNYIHLSANLDGIEKQVVLDHELIHVKNKHTLDLLIIELCHALFWFNPLFFILKKELVYVHEFEVDQEMYGKFNNRYVKHLLALSLGSNSDQLVLTSQFNNGLSLTKRTKKMKNKRKNRNVLSLIIPVIAMGLIFISCVEEKPIEKIYDVVEVAPEFKGGMQKMSEFIGKNIVYPESAKLDSIEGTAYIQFVVSSSGQIGQVKVVKGVSNEIDKEAKKVIESMPDWTPGQNNGENVSVKFTIPIRFRLD